MSRNKRSYATTHDARYPLDIARNKLTSPGYSYFGQHAFYGSTAWLKDYTDQLKHDVQAGHMDVKQLATAVVPTPYVVMTGVLQPP